MSTDSNSEPSPPGVQPDALLDTYFSRFHSKPYHILDESSVRQRLQLNQLPNYLVHGIYAVAARYDRQAGLRRQKPLTCPTDIRLTLVVINRRFS